MSPETRTMIPVTQDLDAALADLLGAFTGSNPASRECFDTHARYLPGANSRSVLFYAPFPLTMARGEGAVLWDVDGHRYDDFIAEYTAGVYGHSAPEIRQAVMEAMEDGINLTGHNLREPGASGSSCFRAATTAACWASARSRRPPPCRSTS